ncbi:MSHA biogenesis protein MshI [Vibrio sp. T187]|uniref:MSHA biogenesis protein MshI n=1 Tax=Vibrio TaxID=662 RepID=UPI0010C9607F|nr:MULTISPECIES: MSHA biogenesis protein MshI [Vibrio]MBW3697248.1 MSHA biogenesis protein MshI [Vibrio sp. T187]
MNLKAILDKLKPAKAQSDSQTVMLQQNALYLSLTETSSLPSVTAINGGDWEGALKTILKNDELSGQNLTLVLDSSFYQTYQIEKPDIPENEWPVALPFLLKDLITERVTEIVADAVILPTGNKLQVYVFPKKTLDKLLLIAASCQVSIGQIVPEDEVWGHAAGELSNFMLLQRSSHGSFKVGAFVENTVCFQRTIRSVVPPLTGVASSALQLDGLALELQRSVDYLSSQLKGTQLHQLKVCCDDEDENELAEALNERLSSKVSRLVEGDRAESGRLLADVAASVSTFSVNLYPEHLRPKKEYFTLTNIVASWLVLSAVLLGLYGYTSYQQGVVNAELSVVQIEARQLNQQVGQLKNKLAKHKPSPEKVAAVARLQREIKAKRDALQAVGQYDQSQQVGYSGVMTALAKLGRNDISLSNIYMNHDTLDLNGYARSAGVVPNWVNQFKNELNLVGRAFEKLKIGRNEQDIITFELRTRREKK